MLCPSFLSLKIFPSLCVTILLSDRGANDGNSILTTSQIRALQRAKVQYDNQKWKTVAETMLEYGCQTKWSPHACQMKWQELHPNDDAGYENGTGSVSAGSYAWANDAMGTTASSPAMGTGLGRKDSGFSAGMHEGDGIDEDGGRERTGFSPAMDQAQRMRQRGSTSGSRSGSVGGSGRQSRNMYEQRQDWTVRPQ
jgi:hypothetical protein